MATLTRPPALASRAAAAFVGATCTPASRSAASCRPASCGSASVPHTCAITGRSRASSPSVSRQLARRVGVRAVAEHDVEQDAARARAVLAQHPAAQLEVDHRVRAALRVLLLAEVEDAVAGAEDRLRLVGERAAGEQAEQRRLPPLSSGSSSLDGGAPAAAQAPASSVG